MMDCPHWERSTADGRCVTKWWAGPPLTWLIDGLAFAAATYLFATIVSKSRGLLPAVPNRRRASGRRSIRRR